MLNPLTSKPSNFLTQLADAAGMMPARRQVSRRSANAPPAANAVLAEHLEPRQFLSASSFSVSVNELNDSGVHGSFKVHLSGTKLKVDVNLSGLEANQLHPMHIHGFPSEKKSDKPTSAYDFNGNGMIDDAEGEEAAGPPLVPIVKSSDPDSDPFDYFKSDSKGRLKVSKTYDLTEDDVKLLTPLNVRAFEVHGMTVDGTYEPEMPVGAALLDPSANSGHTHVPSKQKAQDNNDVSEKGKTYTTKIKALNHSGVSGNVTVKLDGTDLTVHVKASGLVPNEIHPMHIHGFPSDKPSENPDSSYDFNHNGTMDDAEGEEAAGPPLVPIVQSSDPNAKPFNYFKADSHGKIDVTMKYELTEDDVKLLKPLRIRIVEIHGIKENGQYLPEQPAGYGKLSTAAG